MSKAIVQADVLGEEHTGYENGEEKGPFQCNNCKHSDEHSTCGQPVMMKYSKQPRANNGRVKIDPKGCCEYVDRKGYTAIERQPDRKAVLRSLGT